MWGLVNSNDASARNYLRNKEAILVLNESHLNFAFYYLLVVNFKLAYKFDVLENYLLYKTFCQMFSNFITQFYCLTAVLSYENSQSQLCY
jgi:hypothetical protein